MKLSESVKPVSYLKSHTSELIRLVSKEDKTIIITHNGTAKAVLQDIKHYENTQESLALLKILAQSTSSLKKGKYKPIGKVFNEIRKKIDEKEKIYT